MVTYRQPLFHQDVFFSTVPAPWIDTSVTNIPTVKHKWLRPRVVYSRHSNLQEKLLGDLKHKLLWGITDANLGCCPCNCPETTKITGYVLTAAMATLVKIMVATASTLENHSDTSKNESRSILVR